MATTVEPQTPRGMRPPDRKPVKITVPESSKERYGDPFFPKVPFQALFYISAIFAALIILALTNPAPLANPADPLNHEAIDPKPEWYFMFLFQLLKYFPGPFILIGTAIIPGILTTLLLLLPFYDRNWARKIGRRPVAAFSMTGAMGIIILLTWGGLGFPSPNFSTTSQVAVGDGQITKDVSSIFTAHCATCHIQAHFANLNLSNWKGLTTGANGAGLVAGSVVIPGDHKNSILWKVLQAGSGQPGGARMPLGGGYLSDADIATIADWIDHRTAIGSPQYGPGGAPPAAAASPTAVAGAAASPTTAAAASGGGVAQPSYKKDIATIFQAHCAACHIQGQLGGLNLGVYAGLAKGGNVVPGSVVKPGDHANSILWKILLPSNPPGGAQMPLGGPYLGKDQIQTIANWIDQGAKDN